MKDHNSLWSSLDKSESYIFINYKPVGEQVYFYGYSNLLDLISQRAGSNHIRYAIFRLSDRITSRAQLEERISLRESKEPKVVVCRKSEVFDVPISAVTLTYSDPELESGYFFFKDKEDKDAHKALDLWGVRTKAARLLSQDNAKDLDDVLSRDFPSGIGVSYSDLVLRDKQRSMESVMSFLDRMGK